MRQGWVLRALVGAGLVAVGIATAVATGSPLASALIALLTGVGATALAWPDGTGAREPDKADEPSGLPPVPDTLNLLEAVDDPLLIVRNRRVIFANPAARRVLGEHIDGVDIRLAIRHPAAAERLIDREGGETGERVTRTELAGLGEHDRRWEMTVTRLGEGSRLVRLIDRSDAHASEQMRTDFVANASHELRTPLATLLGFLETLSDESVAEDGRTRSRFLRIMWDEARRMHRLVDDLISLSRIEAERFSLPRESVALLPLVEEARAALAPMLEDKGAAIRVDRRDTEPVVAGDRAQLAQLLQNLITNAVKYGRPGTDVTVRFDEAGPEMLRLSVIDEGEGIAAEHLPRLTERFYRVDPSRSRSIGGTGLGLAIVKHIVGRHRGRLDIRSQVGKGTIVHVYLPKLQPVAPTVPSDTAPG
ncbi:MAG TPA: ATP-binding protein [Allosphingosinicella sp.]|jgi:two-component system phosphate regulon sensor histidine kinase PhoR